MKHLQRLILGLAIFLLIGYSLLTPSLSQTPKSTPVTWILLIDTSMSMIGKGGGEDIFGSVKYVVKDFVNNANEGDTIVIYTFDRVPDLVRSVEIKNYMDKLDLTNAIDKLDAKGQWTHTGQVVEKAFERAHISREQAGDPNKPVAVVLFTDDKEDHEPSSHDIYLSQIPLDGYRPLPHTFVVWLNRRSNPPAEITNFIEKLGTHGHLEPIHDPAELKDIRDKVLEFVPPVITMNPSFISFGNIEPGGTTSKHTLYINTNKQTSLRVTLEGIKNDEIALVSPENPVVLNQNQNEIPISLRVSSSLLDGARDAKLVFKLDEVSPQNRTAESKDENSYQVLVSLHVASVSWVRKAFKYTMYALSFLLGSWLLFLMITGKHPPEAWRDYSHLEGQLAAQNPESSDDVDLISLSDENKGRIKLSELQVGRLKKSLDGSDAELSVAHKNGGKFVSIHSLKGSMSVRDTKVASAELYDGDVVSIGDLKLTYTGPNKRPETLE